MFFFFCCCCFFFCCLLEGFIERVVVRGRGLGLLILKTMLNSESCRQRWRAYRVRDHSFKTFSRLWLAQAPRLILSNQIWKMKVIYMPSLLRYITPNINLNLVSRRWHGSQAVLAWVNSKNNETSRLLYDKTIELRTKLKRMEQPKNVKRSCSMTPMDNIYFLKSICKKNIQFIQSNPALQTTA